MAEREAVYTPLWEGGKKPAFLQRHNRVITLFLAVYAAFATLLLLRPVLSDYLGVHAQKDELERVSPFDVLDDRVRYEMQTPEPEQWASKVYTGPPSVEVEQAWEQLIHGQRGQAHGLTLSPEEAKEMGIDGTLTATDGKTVAILGVHHNLHCLRRIRQELYADVYNVDMSVAEAKANRGHSLHCLEAIRDSLVCNADLNVQPFVHVDDPWHPYHALPPSRRRCLDWSAINSFVDERVGSTLAE